MSPTMLYNTYIESPDIFKHTLSVIGLLKLYVMHNLMKNGMFTS